MRKESGSNAGGIEGGSGGGEEAEGGEGEAGVVADGGEGRRLVGVEVEREEEDEDEVRSRPPMTGEGRRVRERVATPGAWAGGVRDGGAGEEDEDKEEVGEGGDGLLAEGARAGESSNWPERVSDRLLGPASSPLGPPAPPPPPVIAVVVAITITAFWGSATVVILPHWSP